MFTKVLSNLLFPKSKLSNSFPWTVQTAGKKYLVGVMFFAIGSFLVPSAVVALTLLLAAFPTMQSCLSTSLGTAELLSVCGFGAALFAGALYAGYLTFTDAENRSRKLLRSIPALLSIGLASVALTYWGIPALAPHYSEVLNFVVNTMFDGGANGNSGKPNVTFVMVLSLISFVMGFGMQVNYIARQMRKSGLSLAKAMALTFEPLKGSWWGATLFNFLLPVAIAYGLTQFIGNAVVFVMGPAHQPTVELAQAATGGNFLLFALMAVIGAPIFEEIVFRGFLFQVVRCSLLREVQLLVLSPVPAAGIKRIFVLTRNYLRARSYVVAALIHRALGGKRAELSAIVISSLMFSLMHMQFQPTTLVLLFMLGCVQAEIYRRTGSLYCGMLLHAVNNGIDVLKLALGQG